MQSVSSDYKELINASLSLSPKSKIVVDSVEYFGDVIKTSPKISHSNSSFIGGFPAKTVSFDIFNLNNNLSLENKEITVYKGLVINGVVEWVKQGVFIPQAKDITNDITTRTMSISNAQDRTQLFDSQYKSSLDWTNGQTHTGLEIVQEICTRLNVTLETTNFAWANYPFKQPNFSELTTDREVISRMAEIGGEVALISSNGGLVIKDQYNTGDIVQRHRYKNLSRENPFVVNTVVLGKEGIDDDIVFQDDAMMKTGIGKNKIGIGKYEPTNYHKGTFELNADVLKITVTETYTSVNNFIAQWKLKLKPNTTYTLKGDVEHSNSEQASNWYLYSDRLWGSGTLGNSTVTQAKTFTTDDTGNLVVGLYLRTIVSVGDVITISKFQIEEGSSATAYSVYEETGLKEIKINDNPYVDLYRQEMIETVASYIIGKSYIPFNINEFVDGFIYELNDVISVVDKNGETFDAVILDYSSASRIKSNVKAEAQSKTKTNYKLAGSKASAINQVKLEVDHINDTITALSGRVEDLTIYIETITGTGNVVLEKTVESEGAIGKLVMSGFNEMALYPNMVYPSKNTFAGKLTTYIIVQTDGKQTNETYIELGMPLSGTDELIIDNNKVYVKRDGKVIDMNMSVTLKTFKDTTTISVKYFDNIKLTCDYLMENIFTNLFAFQAEVSAQFNITNEMINSKVTKAEVISEINQSAEEVGIKAQKIRLEGIVTANKNFKVLEDGSIEAKNGSFSGDIYLTNGGSIVSDKGLLTSIVVESNIQSRSFIGGNMRLPMGYSSAGMYEDGSPIIVKDALMFEFTMPKGFYIRDAYVIIQHMPVKYKDFGSELYTGYSRNLKVYQASGFTSGIAVMDEGMFVLDFDNVYFSEIPNAFGANGFTGSSKGYTSQKSIDIKDYIQTSSTEDKFNILKIETGNSIVATEDERYTNTGSCKATLVIQGYTSFE